VLSLFAFLSVFLLFFGMDRFLSARRRTVESRLDRYATRTVAGIEDAAQIAVSQRGIVGGLNRIMAARGASRQLATELARADLKLTPGEFVAINFIAIGAGFILALFLGHNSFAFGLVGAIIGFYLPRLYVRRRQAQRLTAFNNQLGDTLLLLSNTLRSGYSLLQSMETVSHELPPPMSTEFARVVREIGLGLTVEEALTHMLQRINSDDLDLALTAINIQHEVGGNLAEILDTIAHTIRERVRIKGQIQAMTAMQRLSGIVVALLPIGLAIFMFIVNPKYLSKMWEQSCGIMMIIFSIVTITAGFLAVRKITDIEI
jgi:tight adherence protein B